MKGLLSNAEFRENVTNNRVGYRASVKLGNSANSHFYIRGCSIGRKTESVCVNSSIYKTASAKQGSMLASRGYDGILSRRYLLVGKEAVYKLTEGFYRA